MHEKILNYHSDLSRAFYTVSLPVPDGTPLFFVANDIREMISSYLSDSISFQEKDDIVNEYASLAYAHGWFDAGLFLGYLCGTSPDLYMAGDDCFSPQQHFRLEEKSLRYGRMLRSAIKSVDISPEYGSPLYQAALTIIIRAKKACELQVHPEIPYSGYAADLGCFSYEYGWLDAGLRAGLYRILGNPELFTTETNRFL